MTVAEDREVEATEDIYAENGMKLVAKGYAINAALRERLIRHKLVKPLEDCMAVAGGVTGERCAEVAERLLDSHPALRAMCPSDKGPSSPLRLLKEACPTGRLQTLLTVYAEHRPGKLEHAVRVSLLAMSLAQRMLPKDRQVQDVLLVAGLAHDVGELYIDPQYLQPGARLGPKEWRHIAAHPVIAHGLLTTLEGSAKPAAELILNHHERLDGFGYPLGKRAGQLSEAAQILAVAEMLAGMMERGGWVPERADIAVKLIHGEFSRSVIDAVSGLCKACRDAGIPADRDDMNEVPARILAVNERFTFLAAQAERFHSDFERASGPFQTLLAQVQGRYGSIRKAWSSTGLDVQPDGGWLLAAPEPTQREVTPILKEIDWRMRELEREWHARVARHASADLPTVERFLKEANGGRMPSVEEITLDTLP